MVTSSSYDNPWKEAISLYFQPFIAFFFPAIETQINWHRGYEFLDKEFQQIVRESEIGTREADKLVKVWRGDGAEIWVLIHIEVQSQAQSEFAERMYVYHNRIFDRYRRPVVSLAVLADEQENWRPDRYTAELWGCQASTVSAQPNCGITVSSSKTSRLSKRITRTKPQSLCRHRRSPFDHPTNPPRSPRTLPKQAKDC